MDEHLPWLKSESAKVWNVTEFVRAAPDKLMQSPLDDATLGAWLTFAPWMVPFGAWTWHYSAVIHLRDLPGQSRAPTLRFADATHEFLSLAVDPSTPPDLCDVGNWRNMKFLSPLSIVQQFHAGSDADALARVEENFRLVVRGRLTLESEGRSAWEMLLSDKIPARAGPAH